MRKIYFVTGIVLLVNTVLAQQDTTAAKELAEVVVTGQYKPQSVKNSVYQVRVISKEQIQKQAASKLQDVLSNQLNIRFSQDAATGGSDISMLGLSGQNVKILIDGVPMIGRQGTSNEININQVEVNSIERIEIIEGPMSVIYGADALAGVINIITQKPRKEKFAVNARLHEETVGKEYGLQQGIHNQYVGGSATYKNWYINGGIGRNLFGGWKDSAVGRELLWHKKDQIVGNGMVGYRTSKLNVYYRFDGLDEIITNPANITGSQPALDQEYITDRLMQQLQAAYTFNPKLSANAIASYTHFTRQVYSTLYYPDGDVRVATAPGAHSLSAFNGFTFRGTVLYRMSPVVSFQPGVDINIENGDGERIKTGVQQINDYAFFITSEITPVKRLNIRPGLRFVSNSVYDAPPAIPSLNIKFGLTERLDLRAAYARGFRSPSIRELYFDFHDGSHDIIGNTELQAEYSNSFTGSLTFAAVKKEALRLNTSLSGFYNDVSNMIGYVQSASDNRITTYSNIDKYKTRGATLNGSLVHRNFNASLGFSYTGRYNRYKPNDPSLASFKWSLETNAVAGYAFPKIGMNVNLFYKFTGRLPYYQLATVDGKEEVRLMQTGGYHWADLTINKKLFKLLTLNAGVRNLFDVTRVSSTTANTGTHASSAVSSIAYGRSWFMGLAFNWNKN
ncbi:TonB-dependent receptor [Agriterribacter sp.]|uniref:TonB-dependent receptor plug domain-containing protein n=1 Tax=Agriterribacter sp. TaxID=2821509 RepID=UPI002BAE24B6|nr:TonB-dependent receptor [Agriterribacter sp.]HRO48336.1 TonB-dependent receptor [Agriterribacter sp.]HRQ19423.1 TonB-dependent receptor [Agriterribacter sp.]